MIEECAGGECWSDVLDVVRKCGFEADTEEKLLEAVVEKMTDDLPAQPPAKAGRTSTQNFESWPMYLTDDVWAAVQKGDADILFDHLGRLGLRNPSETTSASLAVGMLLHADGYEKALAMHQEGRFQFVKTTKHSFKHRSKM